MALIDCKNLSIAFGGPPVLDGIRLLIAGGERICVMGRNGEGKSTLLRLLGGVIAPDSGEIVRKAGLRVGYLPQDVPVHLAGTVRDVVAGAFQGPGNEGSTDPETLDWEQQNAVDQALTRAELDGAAVFSEQSAGLKRRTLLARALAGDPELLLLDEPTNHLDIHAIDWIENELKRFAGTLVFVTHDRAFLRALAGRIVELDRGCLRDWACDFDTFLRRRDEADRDEENRWREFDRKLAEEEVWIRKGVRERRTRNEGRVRALKEMRAEREARRTKMGQAKLSAQDAERSGRMVIRARDLDYSWGDHLIVQALTTTIQRGDKVGILGPNGAGKTTLLQILLGDLPPRDGTVEHGTKLQIAYYDQQRRQLDLDKTVLENVTGGNDNVIFNGRKLHAITYLKNFLFSPDRAKSPITHLSGGERNRLLLARLFTQPANVLVLDEPTNDLDLETVELLEELLVEFDGTILLVSHDREFLDNVTTSTLVMAGDATVVETVGGYTDWKYREAGQAPLAAGKQGKKKAARERPVGPRKLTWKEGKELEALPARIEELEAEQKELHARLADPAAYQGDGAFVADRVRRLEELEAELTATYARWEQLDNLPR